MWKIIQFSGAILFFYFVFCYWFNDLFYHFNKQVYIRLWWSTGISIIGSLLLMGLPGVIILGISSPIIDFIWGVKDLGDSAWPLGAIITIILPMLIIPVYYISFQKIQTPGFIQVLSFIVLFILGGIIVSVAVYSFIGKHV